MDYPPRPAKPRVTWKGVSMLMLSDILGTSVLTFPAVASELGYVLTVVLIVGLFPVSLYVSVLMVRTHTRIPGIDSFGSAARRVFGSRHAELATYAGVYGYTLLGNASYLLVVGTSVQGVFYDAPMCLAAATGLGCLVLAPMLVGVRRLGESVTLCFFNLLLILVVVGLSFAQIASRGRPDCVRSSAVAAGLQFTTVFGAASNLVYAYAGMWMYHEMMAEMEAPADFPKAFAVSGPIMVSLYLLVACLGYHYLGEHPRGSLVENVPAGAAYRVVQLLLLLHVTIVYVIKSLVLARFAHARLAGPAAAESRTAASYARHAALSLGMLLFSFLVTNAAPFFEPLLGLIGGLLGGPINFLLPIALYLGAISRALPLSERGEYDDDATAWRKAACVACSASLHLRARERCALLLISAFILGTMLFGTYSTVASLVHKWGEVGGGPFACHPLAVVNSSDVCGGEQAVS